MIDFTRDEVGRAIHRPRRRRKPVIIEIPLKLMQMKITAKLQPWKKQKGGRHAQN